MASNDTARRVMEVAHLRGNFLLRSGARSHEYFDKYRFESDPRLLRAVAAELVALLPDGIDALAGLELGGVPLATVASQLSGLPARFVRKEAKRYGTCRLAEGGEVEGERLAIVEDVISTGGAVLEAGAALRSLGATVATVVCVIDRETGGRENLAAAGLELRSVWTMEALRRSDTESSEG